MITNKDIPETDDIFDPEEFDNHDNMELALDRHGDRPEFTKANKTLKYKDGRPIGISARFESRVATPCGQRRKHFEMGSALTATS